MKRIIQGLVLATLVSTAQASPFPADGEGVLGIPVEWTYADKHAVEPNGFVGSAIPVGSESFAFPAQSTYADKHAGEPNRLVGSAIPEDGEAFMLQARETGRRPSTGG